ncbi:MAG: hypothetical protein E7120_08735 [Bacteroidales bacterium]|nr:hypothetical protein [Bacteroidales bacterium]
MQSLCLILFLCAAALWFFTNEHDTLFGVFKPTCAVRRGVFVAIVSVFLLSAIWFGRDGSVADAVQRSLSFMTLECEDVFIVLLSSMIVLSVLLFFSVKGSATYAIIGALAACGLMQGDGFQWQYALSFLAAPVMASVLSALLRAAFRRFMAGARIHMITLSYYMRQAVIVCLILTAVALGLNWGGLLSGVAGLISTSGSYGMTVVVTTGLIMLTVMCFTRWESAEPSGMFADFSIYAVVSTGFAVALTMLFFSFDATASLIGLHPAPLSVSALVMAAVAGAELAQKSRLVEGEDYSKEVVGMVVAPAGSLALACLMFYIIGADPENQMTDFVVLAASIVALIALAFVQYVRKQKRQKEATDRLVYAQQQQIYEHSRALNDMELKVVLSENQALHNAVEQKRQEVMNVALSIVEQKEFLESLDAMVKRLAKTEDPKEKDRIIAELGSSIKQRLSYDRDVDSQYFYAQAESLHEDFSAKLSENFPDLTQQERRLATLLRLGFSSKYIATLMNITPKSVEISRYRLRQKLGLAKGDNLVNFIKSI